MDLNGIVSPFRKLRDVIKILILGRVFPNVMPDRYAHILKAFIGEEENSTTVTCTYTEKDIQSLSDKVENVLPLFDDNIQDLLEVPKCVLDEIDLKGEPVKHLVPPIKECCGAKCAITFNNNCLVYEQFKILRGAAYKNKCKKCKSQYLLTTYKKNGENWKFYKDACESDYFQSTRCSVFHKSLLKSVDIDM